MGAQSFLWDRPRRRGKIAGGKWRLRARNRPAGERSPRTRKHRGKAGWQEFQEGCSLGIEAVVRVNLFVDLPKRFIRGMELRAYREEAFTEESRSESYSETARDRWKGARNFSPARIASALIHGRSFALVKPETEGGGGSRGSKIQRRSRTKEAGDDTRPWITDAVKEHVCQSTVLKGAFTSYRR